MNNKTVAERYHIKLHQAEELLEIVDDMFEIDYSEISQQELDVFMSMAAARLGLEINI